MTRFRPCIDLHAGQVKQIVGGTLSDNPDSAALKTNYVSKYPAGHFATLYKDANIQGAHVIMLGPGNAEAAREALQAWPGHLQIGGGINDTNAWSWIEAGASKVIVTSFLFPNGRFSLDRLQSVLKALRDEKDKLVIDLSCRRKNNSWFVAMNKWQTITEMEITKGIRGSTIFTSKSTESLIFGKEAVTILEPYCSEFLIHAADNEGLQQGIDLELVTRLSEWCSIPVTYAGGARTVKDLDLVKTSSQGRVDLTIGSALDVFGGAGAKFEDCVSWNNQQSA